MRLVLDKLTNQKFGNLIRYVNFIRYRIFSKKIIAGRMQIQVRKTSLSQFVKQLSANTEKLSVNFNINKVVASSEHESSIKRDSGVWFIRWQCKVLSQSFVILSLDPYRL